MWRFWSRHTINYYSIFQKTTISTAKNNIDYEIVRMSAKMSCFVCLCLPSWCLLIFFFFLLACLPFLFCFFLPRRRKIEYKIHKLCFWFIVVVDKFSEWRFLNQITFNLLSFLFPVHFRYRKKELKKGKTNT